MFCPNCGSNVPDSERFCPTCGTMLQEGAPEPKAPGNDIGALVKKYLPIAVIAVVAVIAIVIVFNLLSGGGPKGVAEQYLKASLAGDYEKADKYAALTSEEMLTYYAEQADKDLEEYLEESLEVDSMEEYYEEKREEYIDNLEEEYGDDYKITVEVKDSERLDDDDFDELLDEIDDVYKESELIDADEVTDAYEVKVKTKIDGDDGKDTATVKVIIIKLGGKWKYYGSAN